MFIFAKSVFGRWHLNYVFWNYLFILRRDRLYRMGNMFGLVLFLDFLLFIMQKINVFIFIFVISYLNNTLAFFEFFLCIFGKFFCILHKFRKFMIFQRRSTFFIIFSLASLIKFVFLSIIKLVLFPVITTIWMNFLQILNHQTHLFRWVALFSL